MGVRRTCGGLNEVELTPAGVKLSGSRRVPGSSSELGRSSPSDSPASWSLGRPGLRPSTRQHVQLYTNGTPMVQ